MARTRATVKKADPPVEDTFPEFVPEDDPPAYRDMREPATRQVARAEDTFGKVPEVVSRTEIPVLVPPPQTGTTANREALRAEGLFMGGAGVGVGQDEEEAGRDAGTRRAEAYAKEHPEVTV